jgi:putative MATE family efflux protein
MSTPQEETLPLAAGEAQPLASPGYWATIKEALRGSHHDFTQGSIRRAIFLLAVPMVLELALESLFAVVNIFYISHMSANITEALAIVGLTESLLTLVFTIGMGVAMAVTATVARRVGEKNLPGAGFAGAQGIWLGIFCSLPITLVGLFFMPMVFRLMGAHSEVISIGLGYGQVIFAGNVTVMLLFINNAIFRGAGDASIAMRSLWTANIVNFILDPCFIFGLGPFPEWGVTGSAVATTIGRGVGIAYQFWLLFGGKGRIKIDWHQCAPDFVMMWKLLRLSFGVMLQNFLATSSWIAMMRIVSQFGSGAIAGYTIAIRIIIFAILPAWGMSNAAATLVGQNLGAQKPERAEKSVWQTGFANMVFMILVTVGFVFFAAELIGIFTREPDVVPFGVAALRYISYGYVFYAWGMVITASFNGAGDTYTPTLINAVCFWLLQIPMAYWLANKTSLGVNGVFLSVTISESILAVIAMALFRRGKWKEVKV